MGDLDQVGDEVTAAWPEEKFFPRPNSYSSCVSPTFTYRTRLRPGESAEQACARAYAVVREAGERCRREKLDSFIRELDETVARAR